MTKTFSFEKKVAALIALCLCAFNAFAELSFSGTLESKAGVQRWEFAEVKEKITGELNFYSGANSAYVKGGAEFDALKATNSSYGLSARLDEAWYSYYTGIGQSDWTCSVKIGRQIEAWGKADEISIADVLCPSDYTSLSLGSYADSRLGIDGVKLSAASTSVGLDLYWVPIFKGSKLPLDKDDRLRPSACPLSYNGIELNPQTNKPDFDAENMTWGARLSFWTRIMDISLYGYYGYDHKPVANMAKAISAMTLAPSAVTVELDYYKYKMIGIDAAIPVKEFVFRLEGAGYFDKAFSFTQEAIRKNFMVARASSNFERKNSINALGGIDWTPSWATLSAQYYARKIFDYNSSLDSYDFEQGLTFSASKNFLAETLSISFSLVLNLNDFDSGYFASIAYDATDNLKLTLSGQLFVESPWTVGRNYGKYSDYSAIYLGAKFTF